MNKFAAMTAASIFAAAIAHSGVTSAADITTINPSFEADARADGESKNSFAGGGVAVRDGSGTTLSRTIGPRSHPNSSDQYQRLVTLPGWPIVVREDMAAAGPQRHGRGRSLVSFVHFTDMHITDPQSPSRNPFARKVGIDFRTDFRNQEALTLQVADAMVQRVNAVQIGPVTGRPFSFVVSTGDNGDERQINELRSYIVLLDGGPIVADTSGQGYVGVQDDLVIPGQEAVYDQYWHPDPPPPGVQPDIFKREFGFPEYPGLLEAATRNFEATGLDFPWYSGSGNHDGALVGYFRALQPQNDLYWNPLGTGNIPGLGSRMFLELPPGMDIGTFEDCLILPDPVCVSQIFTPTRLSRPVPSNPDRAQYLAADFLQMHFDSPATPGPIGHGFTQENIQNDTLYYTFDMAPEIVGIMLDTVDRSGVDGGSIGSIQAEWLEEQLQAHSSRYFDEHGQIITADNVDKLLVLFSHHNLLTMNNATSLAGDPDPMKLLADDIEKIVLRYPNVILWINGHSHVNRIWAHRSFKSNTELQTQFWEVNTASHIDFPQLSRSVEIVDNRDGTLSIFGVLLDHMAPPRPHRRNFSLLDVASISREVAANDPDFFLDFQLGAPADRNVELLIKKPFGE